MRHSITKQSISKLLTVVFFFLMISASSYSEAAETQVSISASNNLAFIGDKINLKIIVKTTHANVQEIKVEAEKRDFDIIDQLATVKRQQTEYMVFEKTLVIAFFKTGEFEIGPFTIQLLQEDEILESKTTNSVPVSVKSVLKEEDKDIKPLKSLVDLKGNPWYLLKYVFAALVIIGLIIFLILWIRKKRKAAPPPSKPLMSPIEELEFQLNQLMEKKLVESGKLKLHFIELTRIIKHFLHRNYGFNAEDSTTEETLYYLNRDETDGIILDNMRFVFNTADLVKFAKFVPDPPVLAEINGKIQEMGTRYKLRLAPPPQDNNTINPTQNITADNGNKK